MEDVWRRLLWPWTQYWFSPSQEAFHVWNLCLPRPGAKPHLNLTQPVLPRMCSRSIYLVVCNKHPSIQARKSRGSHLEEKRIGRGNVGRSPLKGREMFNFFQTDIGTISKALLGETSETLGGAQTSFSYIIDTTCNWTHLNHAHAMTLTCPYPVSHYPLILPVVLYLFPRSFGSGIMIVRLALSHLGKQQYNNK